MSESPPKDPIDAPSDDPIEGLLAQCLGAADPAAALAAAAAAHPQHADELRAGFHLLCRAGLTDATGTAGPERLGRFRLLRQLGGGGMGTVHLAEEEPLGRRVALKRVRPELLHFAGARQRFLREIAAVASLQHPGIVPIYSYGEADGVPYYAMELVTGRSLAELITAQRAAARVDPTALHQPATDWTQACFHTAAQIAAALAHAHDRGIVHRDVKPSNVMLADDGRALLIDFGLARVAGEDSMTRSGVQPGSLAYMSPEQVRGEEIDARTDIWSLGVTLYELLTLRSPFGGDTEESTRQRILHGVVPNVRHTGSGVPWDAAVVLGTAMAPERDRRYATMRDFAADLRAFVEHRPIQARRPSTLLRLRRYTQRRPAVATGLGLGLLLLATLPTALYLTERSARTAVQREADTARAAVTFLEDLFAECEPARARGATVPARAILDRGVLRVRSELRDEPGVQATLLEAMGSAYLNLGLFAEASPLLADAQRLRETHGGKAAVIDRVLQLQARLASARGDDAAAENLWRRVVQPLPPMEGPAGLAAAEANLQLAYALWRQDRLVDAETLTTAAVSAMRRLLPASDARIGKALLAHGLFLQERDDPLLAEPLLTEAERILAAALPADYPEVIGARCHLARNALVLGNVTLARSKLALAETAAVKLFDARHPQLAMVREGLAKVAIGDDRPRDAMLLLDQVLTACRAIYPAPNHVLARALNLQSSAHTALGDLKAADATAKEALGMYEQLYPDGHLDMAAALCNLAMVQTEIGNLGEAIRLGRSSLAMQERLGQRNAAIRATTTAHLGYALAFAGEFAEAERLARAAVDLVVRVKVEPRVQMRVRCYLAEVLCLQRHGKEAAVEIDALLANNPEAGPTWRGWALFLQGWAQELQRDWANAEASLRQALDLRVQTHGPRHPLTGIVLGELGVVLANLRRLDESASALADAVAIRREHGAPGDVHLNLPLINLAHVRGLQGQQAESRAAAEECFTNLRGKAGRGHPIAYGTVKVLLGHWRQLPDPEQRRARLAELHEFAEAVLLPEDPLREQVTAALQAAGG